MSAWEPLYIKGKERLSLYHFITKFIFDSFKNKKQCTQRHRGAGDDRVICSFFLPFSLMFPNVCLSLQKENMKTTVMNEIQTIQSKIYEIRGQRVMLDRDLAELYEVTTGNLNKAVKRNIRRFPPDFMFQLTKEEFEFLKQSLIFQNGISNEELKNTSGILRTGRGGVRQLPYAFTEQGLAMLSGILNSDIAIDVNISIMRAFVSIRKMAAALPKPDVNADVAQLRKDFEELKLDIEEILHDQNDINESTRMQIDAISTALAELQSKEPRQKPRRKIGFLQEDKD